MLTRTLRDQGFDDRELRRMKRDGTLLPVRRGAYVRERPADRTRDCPHGARPLSMTRWPGTRQARRAVALLDPRSESPGESVSRVRLHEDGLPVPDPQQDIFDEDGQFVASVDFCWKKQRTIGEFDGKIKYGCSSQDSLLRTCCLKRSNAKTHSVILVDRLPAGYGGTCIAEASYGTGCCEPSHPSQLPRNAGTIAKYS